MRRGYRSTIFPILPILPIFPIVPIIPRIPPQLARNISCQKGAECYTRQKCHRWVVLDVRPIGGIFSRGRNRPLITANDLLLEGVRLGLSQKKTPRDSTRSTARGVLLLAMGRE